MAKDTFIGKFRNKKTGKEITKFKKNNFSFLRMENGDEFSLWVINELDQIGISVEVEGYEARLNNSVIWLKEPNEEEWEIYKYIDKECPN